MTDDVDPEFYKNYPAYVLKIKPTTFTELQIRRPTIHYLDETPDGEFKTKDKLGTDKATEVFVVEDKNSKTWRMKVFSPLGIRVFADEVKLNRSIDYPLINGVLAAYEQENYHVISALNGPTLKAAAESRSFSEAEVRQIAWSILLSVNIMHERGLCLNELSADDFSLPADGPDVQEVQTQDAGMCFVFLENLAGATTSAADGVKANLSQVADIVTMLLTNLVSKDEKSDTSKAVEEFIEALRQASTAKEILSHPFIADIKPTVLNAHLSNLKSSKISCKMHEVLLMAAYTFVLDNQSKYALMMSFLAADKTHKGYLLPEDMQGIGIAAPIFKRLNLYSSGKLSFHEFCVAAMSKEVLTDENVLKIFKMLDIYEKGFLTLDDFERWFGSKKYPWDSVIKEALQELGHHKLPKDEPAKALPEIKDKPPYTLSADDLAAIATQLAEKHR